jgi:hypothetical protein
MMKEAMMVRLVVVSLEVEAIKMNPHGDFYHDHD